jgi:hypothetical protein
VRNCFLLDSVLMCGLFVCKLDRNSVCARARVCVSEEHQIESRNIIRQIRWCILQIKGNKSRSLNGTFGSVWRAINKQTGEVVCF